MSHGRRATTARHAVRSIDNVIAPLIRPFSWRKNRHFLMYYSQAISLFRFFWLTIPWRVVFCCVLFPFRSCVVGRHNGILWVLRQGFRGASLVTVI